MPDALISPLSIAPMIDWTNPSFRMLMRLIAPRALLYTEMQTTAAIKNNPEPSLNYNAVEHPLALQLGGCDPEALVHCAKIAENRGFVEVNLNLGCPSDRVQAGRFGACMMAEPDLVADCIQAMKQAVSIPVTAKTRIGIDNQDSYSFFANFAHRLVEAGCDKLIVHARKAWLQGLSPRQNRTLPPVHYEYVYQIKRDLPEIPVIINGNISQPQEISEHMKLVDGVMLGRLACNNPYALAAIHPIFYPDHPIRTRHEILTDYFAFAARQFEKGLPLSVLIKPVLNMAHGLEGAKKWKERLLLAQQGKQFSIVESSLAFMSGF